MNSKVLSASSRKRHDYRETSGSKRKKSRSEVRCAICLCACDDLTILDGCPHMFCFGCIEKWMLQKPVCPLCKKAIKQVKHNLPACDKPPEWDEAEGKTKTSREIIESEDYRRLHENDRPFTEEYPLIEEMLNRLREILNDPKNWPAFGSTMQMINELIKFRIEMPNRSRNYVFNHSLFRFVVYYTDADRSALIPSTGGVVLNSEYIRLNRKALTEQWMSFVAREIRAITGLQSIDIESLMSLTLDAIQLSGRAKSKLFAHLKLLGVEHPRTFLKQVQSFGSANQSLHLYDASSRYGPRRTLGSLFTDDDNDVHVVFSNVLSNPPLVLFVE